MRKILTLVAIIMLLIAGTVLASEPTNPYPIPASQTSSLSSSEWFELAEIAAKGEVTFNYVFASNPTELCFALAELSAQGFVNVTSDCIYDTFNYISNELAELCAEGAVNIATQP